MEVKTYKVSGSEHDMLTHEYHLTLARVLIQSEVWIRELRKGLSAKEQTEDCKFKGIDLSELASHMRTEADRIDEVHEMIQKIKVRTPIFANLADDYGQDTREN